MAVTTLYSGKVYVYSTHWTSYGCTWDAYDFPIDVDITTDGSKLYVELYANSKLSLMSDDNTAVTYRSSTIALAPRYDETATFNFSRSENSIHIAFVENHYGDMRYFISTNSSSYSWSSNVDDQSDPGCDITFSIPNNDPTATINVPTLYANQSATINWSLSDPDGDTVLIKNVYRYYKASGASSYSSTRLYNVYGSGSSIKSIDDTIPDIVGGSVYYTIDITDGIATKTITSKTVTVQKYDPNVAPTTPGTPSFSNEIKGGETLSVSWSASSDTNGNLSGYELYVSLDGGSWTQIYKGSSRSYNYTVPSGTESISFRVRAYDSASAYSSYATSSTYAVTNIVIPDMFLGYAGINGVHNKLISGYAGINGVWRSLVNKSFVGINGSWVSMQTGTKVQTLPEGYVQLDYIESSGTQWIDTGYEPNQDTRVIMEFEILNAEMVFMFGVRKTTSTGQFAFYWDNQGNFRSRFNTTNVASAGTMNGRHIVDMNKNIVNIDGSITTHTYAAFQPTYNMYLFTCNTAGSVYSAHLTGRVYSCQIYDNDNLVRDYVPCYSPAGVAGLYDLVNGNFYSSMSGEFIKGTPIISTVYPVPSSYTKVEYIESTGTQYINTGFKPNQNTRVTADCEIIRSSSGWRCVFGARDTGITKCFGMFYSKDNLFYSNIDGTSSTHFFTSSISTLGRHTIDINKNKATIDNESYTHTIGTFQNTRELYLFAVNEAGAVDMFCDMKLYSCQIYDNDKLIRDFVPCTNTSGITGLWDKVNGVFYANSGTGTFTAGTNLNTPSHLMPSSYTEVEYIESSGTQYIDTEFIANQDTRVVMDIEASTAASDGSGLFGCRNSSSSNAFSAWILSGNTAYSDYGTNNQTVAFSSIYERMTVDKNKNTTVFTPVNGQSLTITHTTASFTTPSSIVLASVNSVSQGGVFSGVNALTGRIYSCQIYSNNTLVRDFVPCINSSGEVGMWDKVTGKFYDNKGTGSFTSN